MTVSSAGRSTGSGSSTDKNVDDRQKNVDDRQKKERNQAVDAAITSIEKQFGQGSIMRLGTDQRQKVDAIPTGSIALDLALGVGGVPRGRITEIFGPESSGKTTVCQHILAEAQRAGGVVAFIDVEHALDPQYARACGVDVDNLLVSQPDTGEQALEITETLIRSGGVDCVVNRLRQRHDRAGADARPGQAVREHAGREVLAGVRPGGVHEEVSAVAEGAGGGGSPAIVEAREHVLEVEAEAPGNVDQEGAIHDPDGVGVGGGAHHLGRQHLAAGPSSTIEQRSVEANHLPRP